MSYRYIFGPVPSRRLGVSLGIDLVPFKTCSMDCVYCECGRTTVHTLERKEYVPTKDVISELDEFLRSQPSLDCITFSGSGEPTLHSGIGAVIRNIKEAHPGYTCAVLTNGTLLSGPNTRKDLLRADLVIPSIDAATEETYTKINRPCPPLTCKGLLAGIKQFRQEYTGLLWIEVFIIPGINDTEAELTAIKQALAAIKPDKIQLNKLDRPGTEQWVGTAEPDLLRRIAAFLAPLPVESVSAYKKEACKHAVEDDLEHRIITAVKRRPMTLDDLAAIFRKPPEEIHHTLLSIIKENRVIQVSGDRGIFFSTNEASH